MLRAGSCRIRDRSKGGYTKIHARVEMKPTSIVQLRVLWNRAAPSNRRGRSLQAQSARPDLSRVHCPPPLAAASDLLEGIPTSGRNQPRLTAVSRNCTIFRHLV